MDSQNTLDLIQTALDVQFRYAKGPVPTDLFEHPRWEMSAAHAGILTGLKNLYELAPSVPEDKKIDFAGYCLLWVSLIQLHHNFEEEHFLHHYPEAFEHKADILSEHQIFHDGIEHIKSYLLGCLPLGTKWGFFGEVVAEDPSRAQSQATTFDGAHLRTLVDAFAGPLTTHLQAEIGYFAPESIKAAGMTEEKIKQMGKDTQEMIKKIPLQPAFVYAVYHTAPGIEFPPLPRFITKFLVPWVLHWSGTQVRGWLHPQQRQCH
ncbi:uncharacterized protein EI90DRAFT_1061626 [Cantharellus anzutake]|uniref:uncharacterized protein n=1 Tax=Cantharellus anzutake TaxID=1750568 RepID=UPI001908C693|nr:uncharacterized protein EI90DRAFT_1061626 [Cantharellus anzutake]KAF8331093.1 hypothetical protein EI90DRAFT_1061626 [Cantharellus anzutake]